MKGQKASSRRDTHPEAKIRERFFDKLLLVFESAHLAEMNEQRQSTWQQSSGAQNAHEPITQEIFSSDCFVLTHE